MSASSLHVPRLFCLALLGLGIAAWWSGCADNAYIEGNCSDTDDCQTEANNIPGSTCVDNKCECKSGKEACCPGGDPLRCKANDDYACRPFLECHPELIPTPSECTTADDCQEPEDPRCSRPTCEDGECTLTSNALTAAIASQIPGDCRTNYCDSNGAVYTDDASSDRPVDGEPCTVEFCDGDESTIIMPDASPCPGMENGICFKGVCIGCLDNSHCPLSAPKCDGYVCVPWSCVDGMKDGGETYIDCGGPACNQCNEGESCKVAKDCRSGVCLGGKCQVATHKDGAKNGDETGADCGCTECTLKCKNGEGCKTSSDCISGVCYGGECKTPTCFDGTQNGSEVGTDCGGSCALACK